MLRRHTLGCLSWPAKTGEKIKSTPQSFPTPSSFKDRMDRGKRRMIPQASGVFTHRTVSRWPVKKRWAWCLEFTYLVIYVCDTLIYEHVCMDVG